MMLHEAEEIQSTTAEGAEIVVGAARRHDRAIGDQVVVEQGARA